MNQNHQKIVEIEELVLDLKISEKGNFFWIFWNCTLNSKLGYDFRESLKFENFWAAIVGLFSQRLFTAYELQILASKTDGLECVVSRQGSLLECCLGTCQFPLQAFRCLVWWQLDSVSSNFLLQVSEGFAAVTRLHFLYNTVDYLHKIYFPDNWSLVTTADIAFISLLVSFTG